MTDPGVFVLGLTGSIGMGKSTTAGFFSERGIPVWDADAAVHRLYSPMGAAVDQIATICPEAVVDGAVDRAILREWIGRDDTAIKQLEQVVHPLVAMDRQGFFEKARNQGHEIVVVDIPLLFETGGDVKVNATIVVSAPPEIQKQRVLERPGMTEAHFAKILASQMPDAEKRLRADFVIETTTPDAAQAAVAEILKQIQQRIAKNA